MATRLKTVQYSFPTLASLVNNTLTNLTQITVHIPESGTKTFRKVVAKVTCDDIISATGGSVSVRTVNLQLGAAGYASVSNANLLTNSAENLSVYFSGDFTSHFTTNWAGTFMTCDVQVLTNQTTGTTFGMSNVSVTLDITYEYDDTSTTQLKTVWIPLNAPVGALAASKPVTANDTMPALDTYLPETSKVYRDMFITIQGNEHRNAATTDHTLSIQIDTLAVQTSGSYEGALATDRWYRYICNLNSLAMDTSVTHGFFLWASVARAHHPQAWLTVTYEFNASTTTAAMQSLILPMEFTTPMGGTTSADYQRASRELFIQEPGTIAVQKLAYYMHWDQSGAITGINIRLGTGSFVAYTDVALNLGGGNGCMIRNDAAATLVRGRNTLQADIYRTDATDLGGNVSGFWIVNYTSSVHADGIGAHNKTIFWNLIYTNSTAAAELHTRAATAPVIPEANYYMTALGTRYEYLSNSTGTPAGVTVLAERLAAEGGIAWEPVYLDIGETDPEVGLRTCYSQAKALFWRWPNDPGADRMNLQTARRWRTLIANNCTVFDNLDLLFTYHTITYSVADSISGFTGTVNLDLMRSSGEIVAKTTRAGDGSFAFTWYDNTENLFVCANDGTNVGRSTDSLAT